MSDGTVFDVSQTIGEETAPWPGDVSFRSEWTARIEEGDSSVNLGAFSMSTHLGTHADAPFHFDPGGARSDAFPLEVFCGPAHVVAVGGDAVCPSHVQGLDLDAAPRVLFKTSASNVPIDEWDERFPPVRPDTIDALAEGGAVLVGTDAPSVDPVDSTQFPAHHALAHHGLFNIENLVLDEVDPGRYWLLALPLKLAGMDAAPVRAALLQV